MCLIGEAFGEQGLIVNGAVVNIRLVEYLYFSSSYPNGYLPGRPKGQKAIFIFLGCAQLRVSCRLSCFVCHL